MKFISVLDRIRDASREREEAQRRLLRRETSFGLPEEALDPLLDLAVVLARVSALSTAEALELVSGSVWAAWAAYRVNVALGRRGL